MVAIVVDGLGRSYGARRAIDDLSFTVGFGEVFALVGPDGAGKTTTVGILAGGLERTAGLVSVLGFDPATGGRAYRERIGVVGHGAGVEEEYPVRELARLHARLYPLVHAPDRMVDPTGLTGERGDRVGAVAGGRRRTPAEDVIGCPQLLFLDEPTRGLDPTARHRAWDLIASLRDLGTTVLLTTRHAAEARQLADRVAILRGGRLLACGRAADLAGGLRHGVPRLRSCAGTRPPGVGPRGAGSRVGPDRHRAAAGPVCVPGVGAGGSRRDAGP